MSERPSSGRRPRSARPGSEADGDTGAVPVKPPASRRQGAREAPSSDTRVASIDDLEPEGEPAAPDDGEATQAGPPISVEVIEGPDQGKKKRVRGGRMVVGRGDGCDFKLRDTAASRRHLELIVGASGAVVRDLGSGNGTKINGEPVDEAQVGHGDEILLGVTLLRVIDDIALLEERRRPKPPEPELAEEPEPPPAVQPAAPSKRPAPGTEAVAIPLAANRRKPLGIALAAAFGLLLLVLLVVLLRPRPPPPPPPGPSEAEISARIQQAKQAIGARDYEKALVLCDEVARLSPQEPDVAEMRAHIQKQKDGQAQLAAAEGFIAQKQFAAARASLQAIDEVATAHDRAVELLKGLDGQEAAEVGRQADALIASRDLAGAREKVGRLQELGSPEADRVTRAIATAQAAIEQEQFKGIKNKKKREAMIREAKRRRAQEALRGQLESGFRKFRDAATASQFERAASEFERIGETTPNKDARARAKELARKVRDFARALSEADGLEGDQAYEAEIAPLERAVAALAEVDGTVPAMPRLKARLVRGLVLRGRGAAARQDYGVAAKAFSRALVVHPGDPQAKEGLQQLRGRAHDVYLQAYEEENRDPETARKLYGAVLQMLGPSDEDYQKAKRHLEAMAK